MYYTKLICLISCLTQEAQHQKLSFEEYTRKLVQSIQQPAKRNPRPNLSDRPQDLLQLQRATNNYHRRFGSRLKQEKVSLPQVLHHFVTHKRSFCKEEAVPRGLNGEPPEGMPCRLPKLRCYHDLKNLFKDIDYKSVRLIWGKEDKSNRIFWEYIPEESRYD